MFTGFASENTPAIQVWDFFRTFASTGAVRSVSLADDCAPIQVFRTGGSTTSIIIYLPTAPIEGKQITIVNQQYGFDSQTISVYSADVSGFGTNINIPIITLGQGDSIVLVYSKQCISFGTKAGYLQTGWLSLNKSSVCSFNTYSAVVGGENNTANNLYSSVVGGSNNLASGSRSAVVGGSSNTANNNNSFVGGGTSNLANNNNSFIGGGENNFVQSNNSVIIGGQGGTTRSIIGNFVTPASISPISIFSQQLGTLLLGRQTTNATATVLTSNTSGAGTTNQVILPNNSAYYVKGSVIATVTGGGNTKSWDFIATIKRGANAASTAIVGAVTLNVQAADAGASTWIVAITADTTNGGLAVTVTGQAATTIRWVAKLESTEVTY
jgi:hypothetical protein